VLYQINDIGRISVFLELLITNFTTYICIMNFSVLVKHIELKVALSQEEKARLQAFFTFKTLSKRELLFKEGSYIDSMAFVVSGCLRSYSVDENGFEHILQFAPSGWWITDMLSIIKKTPSLLNVESIVESEVLLLTRSAQEALFEAVPKMERFFRILTENALCATRQRVIDGMSLSAKERYLNFCETYPDEMILSIPQKYVAAYIGVTPEFLSKMRTQLYRNMG
jgi:CRP-like cAMP-binding protein